jgi:asparagine synthase (glutamine-hydrolysing)
MLDAMPHRAPDGQSVWSGGPVGLGHAAHHTTPEARAERWPLRSPDGSRLLVADARIDNRTELIDRLRPPAAADGVVTDAALILAAYERWGRDCPVHLIGDFAFVIWDAAAEILFGARDALGVRPFFYAHRAGEPFAFGSEIKALRAAWPDDRTGDWPIRDEHVGDILARLQPDPAATVYEDVYRLPPGRAIAVTPAGVETWAYWTLDPGRELRLGSDAEYAAAFAERFYEAVRCRLRSAGPVGTCLSGGLDSSSIAVAARDLRRRGADEAGTGPLPAFSIVYDEFPSCDERAYIRAVLETGGFESSFFRADDVTPLDGLADLAALHDEPFLAPNLAVTWRHHAAMREAGVTVLLDGHGGDEVVSHGEGCLHELARSGAWGRLAREIWGASKVYGERGVALLWASLIWRESVRPWINRRHWGRRLLARAQALTRFAGALRRRFAPAHAPAPGAAEWAPLVSDALRARIDLDARRRRHRQRLKAVPRTSRALHHHQVVDPMQGEALEILNRTAAAQGLEARFPFFDRRLVEFCLALPPDQKLRNGLGRYVLRAALQGRLPDAVRLRPSKVDFTPHLATGLRHEIRRDTPVLPPREVGKDYVHPERFSILESKFRQKSTLPSAHMAFELMQALVFTRWLRDAAPRRNEKPQALSGGEIVAASRPCLREIRRQHGASEME